MVTHNAPGCTLFSPKNCQKRSKRGTTCFYLFFGKLASHGAYPGENCRMRPTFNFRTPFEGVPPIFGRSSLRKKNYVKKRPRKSNSLYINFHFWPKKIYCREHFWTPSRGGGPTQTESKNCAPGFPVLRALWDPHVVSVLGGQSQHFEPKYLGGSKVPASFEKSCILERWHT